MIEVELDETALRRARYNLEYFATKLRNLTLVNKTVATQLYGWTIRNFDAEGANQTPAWVPLAERTVREKARIGKERMLVRSGHLRASLLPFWSEHNAGIGSELAYSIFHEEGTERHGVPHVPARKMLPTQQLVVETGLRIYGHFVTQAVREANT